MLTEREDRIIRRAARAQQAYFQLITARSDDARYRLALMDRRVDVDRELRGQPAHLDAGPVDCWISLDEATHREIKIRYPKIRAEVALERERRRLAVNCGRTQLELSFGARVRRKLRRVIWRSNLSIREVAIALGLAPSTLERHLAGERPSCARRDWYDRVESIAVVDDRILISVRYTSPTFKRHGWRVPLEEDE